MEDIIQTMSNISLQKINASIFVFLIDHCEDIYQEIYVIPENLFNQQILSMIYYVGSTGIYNYSYNDQYETITIKDLYSMFSNYNLDIISHISSDQYTYDPLFKYFCNMGMYECSLDGYEFYLENINSLSNQYHKIHINDLNLNSFNLEKYNIKYIFNGVI